MEHGNKSLPSKNNKPELKYMSNFTIKKKSSNKTQPQDYRMKLSYLLNPDPCK